MEVNDYKKDLEIGDVILVYNKASLLNRFICWVTSKEAKQKVAHTGMALGDGLMIESNSKGAKIKNLRTYDSKKHSVYIRRHKEIMLGHRALMKIVAQKKAGMEYAFLQLVVNLFKALFGISRVPDVSNNVVICSELIVEIFKESAIDLFPGRDASNISPQEIMDHMGFFTIFGYECR